jgi:nucleotide-binding universal stress UspA family protein
MDETVFLIPLDGSRETEDALRQAAPHIRRTEGAAVRLLAVLDPAFL